MSRHTQGSLAIVGMIAGGIFLVAFVALMVLSDYSVSAAFFLALFPSGAAAIMLYRGFASPAPVPAAIEHAAPRAMPAAAPAVAPEPETEPEAVVEPEPTPEPEPSPEPASEPVADTQSKPQLYDNPGDGGADDLKKIKGVGPKMEQMLNGMGIWHYSQVASWGPTEVAWVDDNLEGFKGRVTRDEWVRQAKELSEKSDT